MIGIEPGQRWRHFKGGIYVIVANAHDEATGLAVVVYRGVNDATTWVRPLSNFLGRVKDSIERPSPQRFVLMDEPDLDTGARE